MILSELETVVLRELHMVGFGSLYQNGDLCGPKNRAG